MSSDQLTLDVYQQAAAKTAIYPGSEQVWPNLQPLTFAYSGLGLGESGEVQGKLKKVIRDKGGVIDDETRQKIGDELGDMLWYVADLSRLLGFNLGEIATRNMAKLASRAARGTLQGSGDKR